MKSIFVDANRLETLQGSFEQLTLDDSVQSVLFLMADESQYSAKVLIPLLKKFKKPLIGGVFPELIHQGKRKSMGVLLIPLAFKLKTQLFDLSEDSEQFLRQLEKSQKDSLNRSSGLFIFTDALSLNKESFMESVFNFFGIFTTYIGGGAGSLRFKPFPCIIDNQGVHVNAAVIGWTDKKIAMGVAHGWQRVSDTFKVTKAKRNELKSLNWKPAFNVYKEIVEEHSGMTFTDDNFFDIAKAYPLGISRIDEEMVVRDPFKVSGTKLHLIDVINQGEYVNILYGNIDSLLAGALNAREIAFSKIEEGMDANKVFCIDCISRVLFMGDDFKKELEVAGKDVVIDGILTIGEIANSEESFLEIYNKTIVLGIW